MNQFLKSLLRTAVCVMDGYAEQVDRASRRASELVDRGQKMIQRQDGHGLLNLASFAAGVGVGVGAAILFAPASGEIVRRSIKERVQDISARVS